MATTCSYSQNQSKNTTLRSQKAGKRGIKCPDGQLNVQLLNQLSSSKSKKVRKMLSTYHKSFAVESVMFSIPLDLTVHLCSLNLASHNVSLFLNIETLSLDGFLSKLCF